MSQPSTAPMLLPHLPDQEVLAALGAFYNRHRFGAALRTQPERLAEH